MIDYQIETEREWSQNYSWTSFKIAVYCSYDDLVKAFSQPSILGSADDKVQAQWLLKVGVYGYATVYDYKIDGDYKDNTEWHVGARNLPVANLVEQALIKSQKRL